ncbi:MAG: hypothetical protein JF616_01680 [Fibrobacteres bacterium]|nr:hypothetical protein [Fibrobacterota bacterium]
MEGSSLSAIALGLALAFGLQTILAGSAIALGAFRHARPPATARQIGLRLGWRATLGACLPLFVACWIAASSNRSVTHRQGLWIALVVWAGFLAVMSLSETSGRASWFGAVVRVFRRSLAHYSVPPLHVPAWDTSTQARLESEVRESFRSRRTGETLRESLKEFLERLGSQGPDRFEIDREADAFFDDEALREAARRDDLLRLDKARFREMASSRNDLTAEEVAQWTEALYARWTALREAGPAHPAESTVTDVLPKEGAPGGADVSPSGPIALPPPAPAGKPFEGGGEKLEAATAVAQGAGYRERLQGFKDFLRKSDRSALNPDRLERELAHLVLRSENGREIVDKEARSLRREDVARELKQRRDISPREADSIADLIDSARTRMLSRSEIREHRRQEATDQALSRLRDRLYALSRPERDYASFRRALERLLEERLAAAPALDKELREFDKPALQSLFFSKQGISRSDAEKMAEAADAAFRAAEESAGRLHAEIARRRDEARLSVEAEEASVRSLAASSARWLLAISALSGASAALGGWLGAKG